jgi:hypothetical protein
MRVPEEPVCIYIFWQNLVFTSLHLKSSVHVVPPLVSQNYEYAKQGILFLALDAYRYYRIQYIRD